MLAPADGGSWALTLGRSTVKNRRMAVAGLAGLAALAFAVAGCGQAKNDNSSPSSSPTPASPKDALIASVQELQKTSFKFTIKDAESTGDGVVDPATKSGNIRAKFSDPDLSFSINMEFLLIGSDTWAKVDLGSMAGLPGLPQLPNKWMHLDRAKLSNADELGLDDADPAGAADILAAIASVERSGDRAFTGTLDLTQGKAKEAGIVDEKIVTDLADQAKAVPFEATVDDKGRLTSLKIKVPAAGTVKAQTWEVTYSDYGAPANLTKPPAADVVEAPQSAYDLFNG